ncbi:Derlin [Mycena chlorophos]|uniref:Derlin n=1 Tax=Mycena chlorophos TaxID=658473 RepID=A0A8H6TM92_MYCCL|nr:Derlin [Mycena chlorophos]
MNDLVAEIKKIPPVTRLLCISSVAVTVPVMAKMLSPYHIFYSSEKVFWELEVWRLYTSFFLGSGGLNYLFELAMLYRTMNDIESGPYAQKSADLAWQLLVASISIIITSIPVSSFFFTRPFVLCIVYLGSSLAPPGAQTSLFGLFTFPVRWFPYVMLGMDLLSGPGAVAASLPGAIVGHLWWWGIWGSDTGGTRGGGVLYPWGAAPAWFANWMQQTPTVPGAPEPGRANAGGGVHIIAPRRTTDAPEAGGRTTGYNWGSGGNRLGSG